MKTLRASEHSGILHLTFGRPDLRNAMNLAMVEELRAAFGGATRRHDLRAIVLRGSGGHFCAGGDVKDMQELLALPDEMRRPEMRVYSRAFGEMLAAVDQAPQVVIAALEGAVLGGGLGLACAADVALATVDARFGLPETTLGLVPAQIAPFLVERLGRPLARRLALTGARFGAAEAREMGLVAAVYPDAATLEGGLEEVLAQVRRAAPGANAATKQLLRAAGRGAPETTLDDAAEAFTEALCGEEGREGTRALLEKRLPAWAEE